MKKKLICLLLAVVMLAACFAGCGAKDDEEAVADINEQASASAMTLVMYLMSEEEVSEDQVNAIETAVNKITKSKFKTQLELRFYTPDEYYEALEASFAARKDAEDKGLIAAPKKDDESTEEETYEDEWGVSQIKYPTVADYQVDIFYLGGYANYNKYMDMGMLQRLDEELTSSSKKLSAYISTPYLTYMKSANDGTYAIPTNTAIGEYTYLLLNKDALADFDRDTAEGLKEFKSFTSAETKAFLEEVYGYKLNGTDKTDKYTHALYSNLSQDVLASTGVYYWSVDAEGNLTNSFSAMASDITAGAAYGDKSSYLGMSSVLDTAFADQLKTVKEYAKNYNFTSGEAAAAFAKGDVAVACIKGGAEIPSMYAENYEAVVIGAPTLNTVDLYDNMFAVSSYTANTSRSMEIITYLNTNEDFRNLLQYGILDEDYQLVDSDYTDEEGNPYKVVEMLKNDDDEYDYVMDINKTGNTLIAYCTEGENPAIKDFIKQQNIDSVPSLTMGYRMDYKDLNVNAEALTELKALSDKVLKELLACDYDRYDEKVNELKNEIASNEGFMALNMDVAPLKAEDACGLRYSYTEWAVEKKIYERPKEEE